jgi:hypothetical protein
MKWKGTGLAMSQPDAPETALYVLQPEPTPAPLSELSAQCIELLVGGGLPRPEHQLHALYLADPQRGTPAGAALAHELADRFWLRMSRLLPPGLPALLWSGAIDQLGRQHAGRPIALLAQSDALHPALSALLELGRAHDHGTTRAPLVALRRLQLHASVPTPCRRSPDACHR